MFAKGWNTLTSLAPHLGIRWSTGWWVIVMVCVVQISLCRSFLIVQERSCLETYGEEYREYVTKVPRYLFML